MSKRKNKIKDKIACCFLCGHVFTSKEEKSIHRLNPKKSVKKYNVIVVCPHCKQKLLTTGIDRYDLDTGVIEAYFSEYTRDNRHLILEKVFRYLILSA